MTDRNQDPSSTHPPLPPTPEDEQFAQLRLLRSRRVGISTYKRLLIEHGTAQNALAALPEVARAAGVAGYEICPEGVVRAELRAAHAAGAKLLHIDHPDYPAALTELDDAPPFLWLLGDPALLARPMIALVGARNASSLGTRMARTLAHDLGEAGYVVVSGLARGVDAAAHLAALQRLGPTPVAEDQLIRDLQLPPAALTPDLVELEMDGKVLRGAGGLLSRAV